MSLPSSMEVDPPVALDANTGAIALANKSLQIRDKYPDSDDERPSSKTTTPKSSPLHRISPYVKPKSTTTKVATFPSQPTTDTYLIIRQSSENSIAQLSTELDSLKKGQPGRRTKEKSLKIQNLEKQIASHKSEIAKADAALNKAAVDLQQANINATLSSAQAQADKNLLIEQARTHISAIETDKSSLETQILKLTTSNQQLENNLTAKTFELEQLNREKTNIITECGKQFESANKSIADLQLQIQNYSTEKAKTDNLLTQHLITQQNLESQVNSLTANLNDYTNRYTSLSNEYQTELDKLKKVITKSDSDLKTTSETYANQITLLETENLTLRTNLNILNENSDTTVATQSTQIADLTVKLNAAIDTLNNERTLHQNQIQSLNKNFSDIVTQKDSESNSLKQSLSTAIATSQNQSAEINNLRKSVTKLNSTVDFLKTQSSFKTSPTPPVTTSKPTSVITFGKTMATSELSELVSIPLREKIPHFSGYLGDISVTDWFKQAERVAKGGNWSKEQMKRYFSERFTKLALSFQEHLDDPENPEPISDYNEWKDLIIEEFKDPSENQIFKNELAEIKQKTNERVRDFRARLEKLFVKAYNEKLFRSVNEDMTLIRNDILKNAFEGGLKTELLPGYENRIPADADYTTCVTTATDIESILAHKKSISQNRHSEISAISLHQESLTNDVEELKRKFEDLNSPDNLDDRPRKEISAVPGVYSDNGQPYTDTPNLSLNSRTVRFGNNLTDERNRTTQKRPRPNGRSPSPHNNRSPSPYNRTISSNRPTSPFQRNHSPNP